MASFLTEICPCFLFISISIMAEKVSLAKIYFSPKIAAGSGRCLNYWLSPCVITEYPWQSLFWRIIGGILPRHFIPSLFVVQISSRRASFSCFSLTISHYFSTLALTDRLDFHPSFTMDFLEQHNLCLAT